jgi:hypothetical protein
VEILPELPVRLEKSELCKPGAGQFEAQSCAAAEPWDAARLELRDAARSKLSARLAQMPMAAQQQLELKGEPLRPAAVAVELLRPEAALKKSDARRDLVLRISALAWRLPELVMESGRPAQD